MDITSILAVGASIVTILGGVFAVIRFFQRPPTNSALPNAPRVYVPIGDIMNHSLKGAFYGTVICVGITAVSQAVLDHFHQLDPVIALVQQNFGTGFGADRNTIIASLVFYPALVVGGSLGFIFGTILGYPAEYHKKIDEQAKAEAKRIEREKWESEHPNGPTFAEHEMQQIGRNVASFFGLFAGNDDSNRS